MMMGVVDGGEDASVVADTDTTTTATATTTSTSTTTTTPLQHQHPSHPHTTPTALPYHNHYNHLQHSYSIAFSLGTSASGTFSSLDDHVLTTSSSISPVSESNSSPNRLIRTTPTFPLSLALSPTDATENDTVYRGFTESPPLSTSLSRPVDPVATVNTTPSESPSSLARGRAVRSEGVVGGPYRLPVVRFSVGGLAGDDKEQEAWMDFLAEDKEKERVEGLQHIETTGLMGSLQNFSLGAYPGKDDLVSHRTSFIPHLNLILDSNFSLSESSGTESEEEFRASQRGRTRTARGNRRSTSLGTVPIEAHTRTSSGSGKTSLSDVGNASVASRESRKRGQRQMVVGDVEAVAIRWPHRNILALGASGRTPSLASADVLSSSPPPVLMGSKSEDVNGDDDTVKEEDGGRTDEPSDDDGTETDQDESISDLDSMDEGPDSLSDTRSWKSKSGSSGSVVGVFDSSRRCRYVEGEGLWRMKLICLKESWMVKWMRIMLGLRIEWDVLLIVCHMGRSRHRVLPCTVYRIRGQRCWGIRFPRLLICIRFLLPGWYLPIWRLGIRVRRELIDCQRRDHHCRQDSP
ncbi:hypothetical protein BC829DRAFT_299166 [Chytridium lagenaria]|nr:hypothetical protein BC829DRAFT_299166 [Chytridium lagenaria]